MFNLLFFSTLVQLPPCPAIPLTLPPALRIRPDTLHHTHYDAESFELRPQAAKAPLKINVEGQVWRFFVTSAQTRVGVTQLTTHMKEALTTAGWAWQWEERGTARLASGGQDYWLRFGPGGSGELKVVLVQRGEPTKITLRAPSAHPEPLTQQGDFPYLAPWPGSHLARTRTIKIPVTVERQGQLHFLQRDCFEKEYVLPNPITSKAFLAAYTTSLKKAGWEIEGTHVGEHTQLQAMYHKNGRDIRATLLSAETVIRLSVTDVGMQQSHF